MTRTFHLTVSHDSIVVDDTCSTTIREACMRLARLALNVPAE